MNPFAFIAGKFHTHRAARARARLRGGFFGSPPEITRADWPHSLTDPTAFYLRCCHYFDRSLPELLREHRHYFTQKRRGFGKTVTSMIGVVDGDDVYTRFGKILLQDPDDCLCHQGFILKR